MPPRRSRQRSSSPIPDDPFYTPIPGFVRAKDEERTWSSLCPTVLPGVKLVPKDTVNSIYNELVPGKFYAKSLTQHLGPFDRQPTASDLPCGDTFFILQEMGRMMGSSVFRHITNISIPARLPALRPISPTELPGVRALRNEIDEEFKRNLVPGQYFAKSMTRYLGPFPQIPAPEMLPQGESYVILQEMGSLPTGAVFRKVTQINR